jgi:hypothetical protein
MSSRPTPPQTPAESVFASVTCPSGEAEDSTLFDALLREAARQTYGNGLPLLHAGRRLDGGRFEIVRRIGEGGMGVVYEAIDACRGEHVALKTLSQLSPNAVYRLKNEFRVLADVSHPNLVRLHELCADGALWCFSMELVQGEAFDEWVRPEALAGGFDEARLRSALPQLIDAIVAVHAAGKLHRDLKPSNVLVTPEGRVVVLDFGLAIDPELGGVGHTVAEDGVSGTPAYMAPEQAAGQPATNASDFYALGAMLFEALTGRLPFEGYPCEMLVDKRRTSAPRASSFAPGVPHDLEELCARLLSREPGERPAAEALQALFPAQNSVKSAARERRISELPPAAPALVGRDAELGALRAAFAETLREQAVVAFVSGESGMGKSALCEAFVQELRAAGRATVLEGRCYERENVPLRGFDALVDDLSRHLRRLPREEAIGVLPRDVHALVQLFPAFGRVEVMADFPARDSRDPAEQWRRAVRAFAELTSRMRDRGPLCVYLDDAQWLDPEAVRFMRELLSQPEPVPLLLLLGHRSEHADTNPALLGVRDAIFGNPRLEPRTVRVEALPRAAATELARRLLPEESARQATAADIAREACGIPLFIGQLCGFVGQGDSVSGKLSLRAALEAELSELSLPARRLLEQSALAGKPLPVPELLAAAQATHADLDLLRDLRLLRFTSLEGGGVVECYHARLRELVAGVSGAPERTLDDDARAGCCSDDLASPVFGSRRLSSRPRRLGGLGSAPPSSRRPRGHVVAKTSAARGDPSRILPSAVRPACRRLPATTFRTTARRWEKMRGFPA